MEKQYNKSIFSLDGTRKFIAFLSQLAKKEKPVYNLKSVKIPGFGTFIEQNIEDNTEYAKKAKKGDKITWLVKDASWELIVNNEVINNK